MVNQREDSDTVAAGPPPYRNAADEEEQRNAEKRNGRGCLIAGIIAVTFSPLMAFGAGALGFGIGGSIYVAMFGAGGGGHSSGPPMSMAGAVNGFIVGAVIGYLHPLLAFCAFPYRKQNWWFTLFLCIFLVPVFGLAGLISGALFTQLVLHLHSEIWGVLVPTVVFGLMGLAAPIIWKMKYWRVSVTQEPTDLPKSPDPISCPGSERGENVTL